MVVQTPSGMGKGRGMGWAARKVKKITHGDKNGDIDYTGTLQQTPRQLRMAPHVQSDLTRMVRAHNGIENRGNQRVMKPPQPRARQLLAPCAV